MSIGANIRYYRKRAGLTQKELGEQLGVSNKTICSWEIDRTEPPMEMAEKMAQILDCSTDDFVKRLINDRHDRQLSRILAYYDKLTPEGKERVLAYLEDLNEKYYERS